LGSPLKFKGRMNFDFLKIGRKRGFYPNYFDKLGNLYLERNMELWYWKSLEITSLHTDFSG
ncbi:hypothetical protein, partial [Seonamhaeicola sp.]|uniref:hypothetical protein n=1 Tax=Seonamhaeicola sp. TaxID=1912245 RepID=UPI0026362DC8